MKTIAFVFAAALSSQAPAVESLAPPTTGQPLSVFCLFATTDDAIFIGIGAATEEAAKEKFAAHFKNEEGEVLLCQPQPEGDEK